MNETADKTLKVCQMKIMASLCKRINYMQRQVVEAEAQEAAVRRWEQFEMKWAQWWKFIVYLHKNLYKIFSLNIH